MFAAILQTADTLATSIPSFSQRFNFTLPLIVVLVILMFFLLLKSYNPEHTASDEHSSVRRRKIVP